MNNKEHAIRVAFSELRGNESARDNANDTLAEEGIRREDRIRLIEILDRRSPGYTEDRAVARCKEALPHLFQ